MSEQPLVRRKQHEEVILQGKKTWQCSRCHKKLIHARSTKLCVKCLGVITCEETDTAVLKAIIAYKEEHQGLTPTLKELAKLTYYAAITVRVSIRRMEQAGKLEIIGRMRRFGIKIPGGKFIYEPQVS